MTVVAVPIVRLTVAEIATLPALCGPDEMCRIWGIQKSQFYKLLRTGAFDQFKAHPAIPPKQFCGSKLTRYLQGDPLYTPTFGRRRA